MTTLLTERGPAEFEARTDGDGLWLDIAAAERATGWELKPEGLCRGPVCVPVPPGREGEFARPDAVNVAAFWRHMGKPVLHDDARDVWLLGEDAATRVEEMQSLEAPDFALPDLDGRVHRLSDYRGKQILLVTWASW